MTTQQRINGTKLNQSLKKNSSSIAPSIDRQVSRGAELCLKEDAYFLLSDFEKIFLLSKSETDGLRSKIIQEFKKGKLFCFLAVVWGNYGLREYGIKATIIDISCESFWFHALYQDRHAEYTREGIIIGLPGYELAPMSKKFLQQMPKNWYEYQYLLETANPTSQKYIYLKHLAIHIVDLITLLKSSCSRETKALIKLLPKPQFAKARENTNRNKRILDEFRKEKYYENKYGDQVRPIDRAGPCTILDLPKQKIYDTKIVANIKMSLSRDRRYKNTSLKVIRKVITEYKSKKVKYEWKRSNIDSISDSEQREYVKGIQIKMLAKSFGMQPKAVAELIKNTDFSNQPPVSRRILF